MKKIEEEMIKKAEKAYSKRLEHRYTCTKWKTGVRCIDCGFGLTDFFYEITGHYLRGR